MVTGMVFGNEYRLGNLLAKGAFASVYLLSDSKLVAKLEKATAQSSLRHEYQVYRRLSELPFVPHCFFFGEESGYLGLILENVGYDIEKIFHMKRTVIPKIAESSSIAAFVAIETIQALEHIHSLGVIHCDLKPANILYGQRLNMRFRITIIDFGGSWIEDDPGHTNIIGNEYFASPRQLSSSEGNYKPSKVDDLVSLAYIVIYLAKDCSMVWDAEYQGYLKQKTPESVEKWCLVKAGASSDHLCSGLPEVYDSFLVSVLSLAPEVVADYNNYIKMFSRLFEL